MAKASRGDFQFGRVAGLLGDGKNNGSEYSALAKYGIVVICNCRVLMRNEKKTENKRHG